MAYRRKSYGRKTSSYRAKPRKTARKTYGKRRAAPKRKAAKRRTSGGQRITLVIQQAPVQPTLATPAAKAAPARARFGG